MVTTRRRRRVDSAALAWRRCSFTRVKRGAALGRPVSPSDSLPPAVTAPDRK
jgi:hypothetical protein